MSATSLATTCKACNITSGGMINIYEHPNNLDSMYRYVSGIEQINVNDALCVPCYDDLKVAFNFKQKCIQSNLLRKTRETNLILNVEQNAKPESIEQEQEPLHSTVPSEDEQENIIKSEQVISNSGPIHNDCDNGELLSLLEFSDGQNNDADISEAETMQPDVTSKPKIDTFIPADNKQLTVFTCDDCGKTFNRSANLRRHQRLIHFVNDVSTRSTRRRTQKLLLPSKTVSSDLPESDLAETQCEFCYRTFSSENERQLHEIDHKTEGKPYRCNFENCASQFKERFGLRKHLETHSSVKKFQCRFCDKRFHQRGNALSHERYHTGEKPFVCDHCGKRFAESGNLKAHIRFHTGERPYKCPEPNCRKQFTTHYSHKIHIRSHTKEKPYLCNDCGKRFTSSGKLLVHRRIHSGYRPYKCDRCSAAFVDSSGLKRHLKIH